MRIAQKLWALVLIFTVLSLLAGCAEFWTPRPGRQGAATQPSPAQDVAAAMAVGAAATTGTPISPFLSLAASSLAILAAFMAKSHSNSAKYSACQAGVLLQSFNAQGQKPGEN